MKQRIMFGKFKAKNTKRTVLGYGSPGFGKIHKSGMFLTAFLPFLLPMSDISSIT
jgi:hypothetical protein